MIRPYAASDAEAVSACLTEAAGIDPTLRPCALDEWRGFVSASFNNDGRDFVVAEVGGRVVGVLMSTRYPAEGRLIRNVRVIVHPHFRQRGIGRALADVVEKQDPGYDTTIRSCCVGTWTVGLAMLEARGFRIVSREQTMTIRPTGMAPIEVAEISIRPATRADDADWVRLVDEGYADGPNYSPLTASDIATYRGEDGFRMWYATGPDGAVVGKCHVRPFGGSLWINSVVVSPTHRGRRVGRALMVHALNALTDAGVDVVHLAVRLENAPAMALYESLGFEVEDTDTIWWK